MLFWREERVPIIGAGGSGGVDETAGTAAVAAEEVANEVRDLLEGRAAGAWGAEEASARLRLRVSIHKKAAPLEEAGAAAIRRRRPFREASPPDPGRDGKRGGTATLVVLPRGL